MVYIGPFLQAVGMPLDCSPAFQQIACSPTTWHHPQTCWKCINFLSSLRSLIKPLNNISSTINSTKLLPLKLLPIKLCTTNHKSLSLVVQPILHLLYSPFVQAIAYQFGYKDTVRDHCKDFIIVNLYTIHCSPFIHRASHLIRNNMPLVHLCWLFSVALIFPTFVAILKKRLYI